MHDLLKGDTQSFYAIQYASGRLFAQKYQPPRQQLILVVTDDPFDPNAIRAHAAAFSADRYRSEMSAAVDEALTSGPVP